MDILGADVSPIALIEAPEITDRRPSASRSKDRGGVAASPEVPAPPMAAFFSKKLVVPATAAASALRGW